MPRTAPRRMRVRAPPRRSRMASCWRRRSPPARTHRMCSTPSWSAATSAASRSSSCRRRSARGSRTRIRRSTRATSATRSWPSAPSRCERDTGAGVMTRIVDLSFTIEPSPQDLPEFMRIDISYTDHRHGAGELEHLTGAPPRLLRNEEGPAGERLSLGTHATTHLDAPWHYNSTIGGERAQTIDELPLEWFYGPGVVVDARQKADGDPVTREEMEAGIAAAGHALHERDIVLVNTGRDAFVKERDFMFRGPGVSPEATCWLYEQGVRVMGIDAWGWDAPLDVQAKEAIERDEQGIFWGAHQVDLPYSQIERLTNLGALPSTGFTVACFPLKVQRASAGPARVVAILDGAAT